MIIINLFRAFLYFFFSPWTQPKATGSIHDGGCQNSQLVVAIPFGGHNDGDPIGASNEAITGLALTLAAKTQQKLFVQWESLDHPNLQYLEPSERKKIIAHCHGQRGEYHIDTRQFCEALVAQFPDVHTVTMVAHPDHMWRCVEVLKVLGIKAIIPSGFEDIPYDPKSRQPWCRNKWWPLPLPQFNLKFMTWPESWGFGYFERVARAFFALKGWI